MLFYRVQFYGLFAELIGVYVSKQGCELFYGTKMSCLWLVSVFFFSENLFTFLLCVGYMKDIVTDFEQKTDVKLKG